MEFLSKSQKEHSLTSTWKQTLPKEQLKEELRQQLILKVSKGLSNHFSTFFSFKLFFWEFKKFSYIHTHILSILTFLYGVQSSLFSILLKLVFAKKCMYRTHTNSGPDSSTRPPIENSIRIPIQKLSSKIKDLL